MDYEIRVISFAEAIDAVFPVVPRYFVLVLGTFAVAGPEGSAQVV